MPSLGTETSESGAQAGVRQSARLVSQFAAWAAYMGLSAVFLWPLLTTAIVADDFLNPFYQYDHGGGASPLTTLKWFVDSAHQNGHFNYLGQFVGAFYTSATMWAASVLGIRFSTMYALVKFLIFVGVAVASGAFLKEAAAYIGREISAWRSRILVSIFFFTTLQLHIIWSNDPVGSYPMSGFMAALFGVATLTLALIALRDRRPWMPWVVAVAATCSVLYYEINAAAIGAIILMLMLHGLLVEPRESRKTFARYVAPIVIVPLVLALALQLRAAPQSDNYEGTSVSLDRTLLGSYAKNVVSSLPGAAWTLSRDVLGHPLQLRLGAFVSFVIVAAVVVSLAVRFGATAAATPYSWRRLLCVASLMFAYWFGATLIQSVTAKVQLEVTKIGMVYNFYAVGATMVATGLALAYHLAPVDRIKGAIPAIAVGFLMFALIQNTINWDLRHEFNVATMPNQRLLVAYTERWPMEDRCEALTTWAAGSWPDYYEVGMINGLQVAYADYRGEPFCANFVRPP
jgi:hypothetical protein